MPDFDDWQQRYMHVPDSKPAGSGGSIFSPAPPAGMKLPIYEGCDVTPLIGGKAYFADLKREIDALGKTKGADEFIYISGWVLSPEFELAPGTKLVDLLIEKANQGVDVKVLGWVMPKSVLDKPQLYTFAGALNYIWNNRQTMKFIKMLRAGSAGLANTACLNILSHPAGAVHMKMVVLGTASQSIGYTGGVDLEDSRLLDIWHDVQARVTGPAVEALHLVFRQMWYENRKRAPDTVTVLELSAGGTKIPAYSCTTRTKSMPEFPSWRKITSTSTKKMHVQSMRTLPQFHFHNPWLMDWGFELPTNEPLGYAPDGVFEVAAAWKKGVSRAQDYIYIEDQSFMSTDVFDWLNDVLRLMPELKLILVIGGQDPQAPSPDAVDKFLSIALNKHLLAGLLDAKGTSFQNTDDEKRIGFFKHFGGRFIHTKSTIVDDRWAIIGSANAMRRSLYTDFEHAIGYMDEDNTAVAAYREALWKTHLKVSKPTMEDGIDAWFALPYAGSGTVSPTEFARLKLPLPAVSITADEQVLLDSYVDADSRQVWGEAIYQMAWDQLTATGWQAVGSP